MTDIATLSQDQAVKNFQEYLKIRSVQPDPDYASCVAFIRNQALEIGLCIKVHELVPKRPIVVLTWEGLNPKLPSILLNGHMDVVPVDESKWTHDPFGAEIDENGNIYARGAQDMKSVSIQYLEAIRRIKNKGVRLVRTIHISFVPDEEIGGQSGMQVFVKSPEFKALNIGISLDEGTPYPTNEWIVFHGEKVLWQFVITCVGTTGHACIMLPDTAAERAQHVLNTLLGYREKQKLQVTNPLTTSGGVTSVNLTTIHGGMQENIVPTEIKLGFDCRVAVNDAENFEKFLNEVCDYPNGGISIQFNKKNPVVADTKLEGNPYWEVFEAVAKKRNQKLISCICPGVTDTRFIREEGIRGLGFSPLMKTPILLHANDECVNIHTFLEGINIYEDLITGIANVEKD